MDISDTIAPKSDQLNADDLLTGPRTFTVEKVTQGSDEQPVNVFLIEHKGKPFRPSKTVRRILIAAWGANTTVWVGRSMTLYRDHTVKWAGEAVGGIRVSHLSHLAAPMNLAVTVAKNKRERVTIQPLAQADPTAQRIAELRAEWVEADAERKAEIEAEVALLTGGGAS